MKRIGILSDTHLAKPDEEFRRVVERYFSDVDILIHAGDMTGRPVLDFLSLWDLRAVSGNMDDHDLQETLPCRRIEDIEGRRIGIIHGRGSPLLLEQFVLRSFEGVDMIVFGHSHVPTYLQRGSVYLINPGSYKSGGTLGILEVGDEIAFHLQEIR